MTNTNTNPDNTSSYLVSLTRIAEGTDLFKVGFNPAKPANNDTLVKDAVAQLNGLGELGGKVALINGPASLPVAMVIAHSLAHLYGAVAGFDPKMGGYIVAIAHGGDYAVGDLIPVPVPVA